MKRLFLYAASALLCASANAPAEEPSPRFYDLPRIIAEIERSPTVYTYDSLPEPETLDLKKLADGFWPPKNGVDSPQILEDSKSRKLVEFPLDPKAWEFIQRAEPFFKKGEYQSALENYKKALVISPRCYPAQLYIGDCYFKMGLFKDALARYRKAIALNPDDFHAHFFAADALMELKRPQEALDSYVTSLSLRPRRRSVLSRVKADAKVLRVAVNDAELQPQAFVKKSSDGVVQILVDANELPWFAYATCKAYWLGDRRASREGGAENWSVDEEQECLAALLAAYLDQKEMEPSRRQPEFERLHAILKAGYLPEYVFYEIASRMEPNITLLLDKPERERIKTFVSKFVIVPVHNKN